MYQFGSFSLDEEERVVSRDGIPLPMTPKAFQTLLCFVRNPGRLITKGELLKEVWPDTFVEEVNLAVNISTLRKTLRESPKDCRYIATIPGYGYRFVAEVLEVANAALSLHPTKSLAELDFETVSRTNVQAYDYYLRGRQFFDQMRRKGLEFARQMFARAVVIDPGYARAYAGVGNCCSFLYMWCEASRDNLQEALSASRHAIEVDPRSAEAHTSRGLAESLSHNYEAASNEFETALHLNSQLFDAYFFYGKSCFEEGRFEKAAGLFARASQANPDDYQAPAMRGGCFRALNSTREASEAFGDCLRNVERHLQLYPNDARAVSLGLGSLCGLGDHDRALEWADRSRSMEPEEPAILYNVACAYALLGERDRSIDLLSKAFRQGYSHKVWIENDPDFSSIRDHSRFKALMKSL